MHYQLGDGLIGLDANMQLYDLILDLQVHCKMMKVIKSKTYL